MRKFKQLAIKTHLEVQQRESIRRDLAERMKFVHPDLRVGEQVSYWQEDPSKIQQGRKSGKRLKVSIIAVGLHGCYQSEDSCALSDGFHPIHEKKSYGNSVVCAWP